MKVVHLRASVTVFATITAFLGIIVSFFLPAYKELILTLETVMLPAIYAVGHTYIEDFLSSKHQQELEHIIVQSDELEKRYWEQVIRNDILRQKLKGI